MQWLMAGALAAVLHYTWKYIVGGVAFVIVFAGLFMFIPSLAFLVWLIEGREELKRWWGETWETMKE